MTAFAHTSAPVFLPDGAQAEAPQDSLPERCPPRKQTVTLFKKDPLLLDAGRRLSNVRVAYHTYGAPHDEAILVLHALTGNSAIHEWWPEFLGEGRPLDPTQEYIICSNVLGGCAGSTGPSELDDTPLTLRDMARVGRELLNHLGVKRVKVIGASMGGMLAYAWLLECPDLVERAVIIGAPARHSPWAIGLNTAARNAIKAAPGGEGLKVARQIAMLSYRSPESFAATQSGQRATTTKSQPAISSYLEYQGEKLMARFCERSYVALTGAMDTFQPSDFELDSIKAKVLVVGISSDVLYPATEVKAYAHQLSGAHYWELNSIHGHDAFLMDAQELPQQVKSFLQASNS